MQQDNSTTLEVINKMLETSKHDLMEDYSFF